MNTLPFASLLAATAVASLGLTFAVSAAPKLPDGYEIYHSITADFDGDGAKETAYALEGKEVSLEYPPRLWVVKGNRKVLDLWLKDTNALSNGNAVRKEALQAADLTGDGTPELLFLPSSTGGSGGTQYPRVVRWAEGKWVNVPLTHRTIRHLSENGGAALRGGALYLYELMLPSARYRSQRFTYRSGKLVGGPIRQSRARRNAGLKELELLR